MRAAIELRPEESLDFAARGQGHEERPVSENCSRPGIHPLDGRLMDRVAGLEVEELQLLGVDDELDVGVGRHP